MDETKVLLVCGSGASSGFMATNINKAAKKRGLNLKATARSVNEVDSYIDTIRVVMIGPHMQHLEGEIQQKAEGKNVAVGVMKKSYYVMLDGEKALDHILNLIGEEK